jgi:hypothetical protein
MDRPGSAAPAPPAAAGSNSGPRMFHASLRLPQPVQVLTARVPLSGQSDPPVRCPPGYPRRPGTRLAAPIRAPRILVPAHALAALTIESQGAPLMPPGARCRRVPWSCPASKLAVLPRDRIPSRRHFPAAAYIRQSDRIRGAAAACRAPAEVLRRKILVCFVRVPAEIQPRREKGEEAGWCCSP